MPMPMQITFKELDHSDAVETRVRELSAKLDRLCDNITRCDVVVEAPPRHHRKGARFHVRIDLTVPGREIVVSHDPQSDDGHEDVYLAVRDAFDAARRQLEAYVRERRESHRVGTAD
jgi:ribosomal subunit interface protein